MCAPRMQSYVLSGKIYLYCFLKNGRTEKYIFSLIGYRVSVTAFRSQYEVIHVAVFGCELSVLCVGVRINFSELCVKINHEHGYKL